LTQENQENKSKKQFMNEEDNFNQFFIKNNIFVYNKNKINEKLIDYLKNKGNITRLDLECKILIYIKNRLQYWLQ
jgi:hypothetical protein